MYPGFSDGNMFGLVEVRSARMRGIWSNTGRIGEKYSLLKWKLSYENCNCESKIWIDNVSRS